MIKNKKINFKVIKRLFLYMKKYKIRLILVALFILMSSAVGAISSVFLRFLIDDYISPLLFQSRVDYSELLKAILIMMLVYIIGVLCTLMYNRIMAKVSQKVLKNIRDDMFSHMQTLPIKYFDCNSHGDIMSYYTNDTDSLRQMLTHSIPHGFSAVVAIITIFASMLYTSIWLTGIVIVFVIITMLITSKFIARSGEYFTKQQNDLGDINGYIEEMISGQKVIKVFCYENKAIDKFCKKNETLCKSSTLAATHTNVIMSVMMHIGYVLYFILAVVGSYMALNSVPNISLVGKNILTLGMIASFLQLSVNFISPISQISNQFNSVVTALAGAERIFEFIDESSESDKGKVRMISVLENANQIKEVNSHTGKWAWKIPCFDKSKSFKYKKLCGEIIFSDVSFGYDSNKMVLHNINLVARPGQKIAFVVGTGAGKTTVANLINRFYDVNCGTITYDGINIKNIKKSDLRRSMAVVLQDVTLFTGTVMENIRYGRPDATDEECVNAAKLVHAHEFIELLPEKYQTVISGSESNLSQGQRQLLSIARAAVADPPVMILDEATSSVDTRTESLIQKGMNALMKGRTVFVIAHRLSTIKNSDLILVLDKGKIVERGNHKNLISKKGEYYKLYTN